MEHQSCHRGSVKRPVVIEDAFAERLDDCCQAGRTLADYFPSKRICVDDIGAPRRKQTTHRGLAGPDPTREDHANAVVAG
jgi:hypothetical protein